MSWLAVDIGGANIKISDGAKFADSSNFALWKRSSELAQELRKLLAEAPVSERLAVTMTGELADCFETKEEGVEFILNAVEEAASSRHTRCYLVDGKVVTFQVAKRKPLMAAASNWHALARFCGRFTQKDAALLLDIGSTTCDIIPIVDGEPATDATTDTERMLQQQLVFTGVERSPICALVNEVPYRNQMCGVAQEVFATTLDTYLLLGDIAENTTYDATADGRNATKAAARNRIGRMICAGTGEFNHRDAVTIAQYVAEKQSALIATAVQKVIKAMGTEPQTVIVAGHGQFLALRVLRSINLAPRLVFLEKELGGLGSRCATAYALAALMNEVPKS